MLQIHKTTCRFLLKLFCLNVLCTGRQTSIEKIYIILIFYLSSDLQLSFCYLVVIKSTKYSRCMHPTPFFSHEKNIWSSQEKLEISVAQNYAMHRPKYLSTYTKISSQTC